MLQSSHSEQAAVVLSEVSFKPVRVLLGALRGMTALTHSELLTCWTKKCIHSSIERWPSPGPIWQPIKIITGVKAKLISIFPTVSGHYYGQPVSLTT